MDFTKKIAFHNAVKIASGAMIALTIGDAWKGFYADKLSSIEVGSIVIIVVCVSAYIYAHILQSSHISGKDLVIDLLEMRKNNQGKLTGSRKKKDNGGSK
jgi:hypothetical protein